MTKTGPLRPAFYRCTTHGRFHGCSYAPGTTPADWMPCYVCHAVANRSSRLRRTRGHISLNRDLYLKFKEAASKMGLSISKLIERAVKDVR